VSTGSNSPSDDSTADPGYTLWEVLRRDADVRDHADHADERGREPLADAVRSVEAAGVVVRGL
jgi:hypothetical protein